MTDVNELIETELEKQRTKGAKDKKKRKSLGDRIKRAFGSKNKEKEDHPVTQKKTWKDIKNKRNTSGDSPKSMLADTDLYGLRLRSSTRNSKKP